MSKMLGSLTCAAMAITLASVAAGGCATTNPTSQGWLNQPTYVSSIGRTGHVEWIEESIQRHREGSGAGAVVGAVIGGIIGYGLTGDHGGTMLGAVEGAMIGADAGSTTTVRIFYQVIVRFDDGNAGSFIYEGWPPFQVGQPVQEVPQGLVPL